MPATVIDTNVVTDAVFDPWTEVILDRPLGSDQVVAVPLTAMAAEPPSTYAPLDPTALVPPAVYRPFVETPGAEFELLRHPDAPERVSCRLNQYSSYGDGDYAIATRDPVTSQFSTPYMRNNPRIFGVSKVNVRQGDWVFVWGIKFRLHNSRSGLYLVRNGTTTPIELPLKPNVITEPAGDVLFVKPVKIDVEPGIYWLVAHNGNGGQYGWSSKRMMIVSGALTFPSTSQTIDPSNPAGVTAEIQGKINTLGASGGGTLYWPAGTYTLTGAITLQPKIRNVALGEVRVNRSYNTLGVPMFYPDSDCSFDGFTLEPHPIGDVDALDDALFGPNANKGSNLTLRNCRLVRGVIGEWSSMNLMVRDCVGERFALNQLKASSTVYNYRSIGAYKHPISTWEGRDIAIVNCDFEATERGIVSQPHRGSSSILGYRLNFRDVNHIPNGSEALILEGGVNWDSVPFTTIDSTHITLGRDPSPVPPPPGHVYDTVPSIQPGKTHAFFRYAAGQGEAIRISAYDPATRQVTLETPRRGTATVANVELAWGHVESLFLRCRRSGGGTAPGVMFYCGFTHNVVVEDFQSDDGGAVSFHRNGYAGFQNNTQQQNWINNCRLRMPVWQYQGANDNPPPNNQTDEAFARFEYPGGIFYYESSARFNLVSNTVVELPSVNNSNQMAYFWEAVGTPVVQRCLAANSGNMMSRCFVRGAKPYVLNRRGVLRNCVSDYLRLTTRDGTTKDLTWDGDAPTPSSPLSRQMIPPGETWMCVLHVAARDRNSGASKMWTFAFALQRSGATTALVGAVRNLFTPDATPPWTCAVSADATNNSFRVACTGAASTTIDWLGSIEVLKVAA